MTIDDLRYDPLTHQTLAPDGSRVPHVTEILRRVGLAGATDHLPPSVRDHALARGQTVHALTAAFDLGTLDWTELFEDEATWVMAWADACRELGLRIVARERRVYHPDHHYTGIVDAVCQRGDHTVLVEIKTGDPDLVGARYQTAAYAAAWAVQTGGQVHARWAVWLCPTSAQPYKVLVYDDPEDWAVFEAALRIYRVLARRGQEGRSDA